VRSRYGAEDFYTHRPATLRCRRPRGEEAVQVATILFPQAKLHSEVMVNLHPGSRVMLCDAFCLPPQRGAGFFDFYRADLEVRWPEISLALNGQDILRHMPGVSHAFQALATFMLVDQGLPVEAPKSACACPSPLIPVWGSAHCPTIAGQQSLSYR